MPVFCAKLYINAVDTLRGPDQRQMAVDNVSLPASNVQDGGLYCYPRHKKIATIWRFILLPGAIPGVSCALGHKLVNGGVTRGSI